MKTILAISGSASENSSNLQLLKAISAVFSDQFEFDIYDELTNLPLFTPRKLNEGIPELVSNLKTRVSNADAVIVSTPEYLHNIPAVLKNALEWMTESGELADKPVLPITFTPHEPRGIYAMASLVESLKASKAKVVAELPLFQNEMRTESGIIELNDEHMHLIQEALKLLVH
ncbi:MAG: NAD(P)H-dependent oxidoreductase [Flavobacteriales bacterium]|nr:NAD(P)H-dependent oxidoreductase [Flavobacteriales bacterium]